MAPPLLLHPPEECGTPKTSSEGEFHHWAEANSSPLVQGSAYSKIDQSNKLECSIAYHNEGFSQNPGLWWCFSVFIDKSMTLLQYTVCQTFSYFCWIRVWLRSIVLKRILVKILQNTAGWIFLLKSRIATRCHFLRCNQHREEKTSNCGMKSWMSHCPHSKRPNNMTNLTQ